MDISWMHAAVCLAHNRSQLKVGRFMSKRSKVLFVRHLQVSLLISFWVTVLLLPIAIWPISDSLWHSVNPCKHKDQTECFADQDCKWQVIDVREWDFGCVGRVGGYLQGLQGLWGTMMLQFVFSVYTNLGNTVKFTLQAVAGTLLAATNMFLLNVVLGRILGGGAYRDSFSTFTHETALINSHWLPLCTDGFIDLTDGNQSWWGCPMNIWMARLSWGGFLKFAVVCTDFLVYVLMCLLLSFDTTVRVIGLSTHIYFMMSFVNPSSQDFDMHPAVSAKYVLVIAVASMVSIGCFVVPLRFTAADSANRCAAELVKMTALVIKALPDTSAKLLQKQAVSMLDEIDIVLADYDKDIEASWFENFRVTTHRRWHRSFFECLQRNVGLIRTVCHVSCCLSSSDRRFLATGLESLHDLCDASGDLLERYRLADGHSCCLSSSDQQFLSEESRSWHEATNWRHIDASQFRCAVRRIAWRRFAAGLLVLDHFKLVRQDEAQENLSRETQAFICAVSGVAATFSEEILFLVRKDLEEDNERRAEPNCFAPRRWWKAIRAHFDIVTVKQKLVERSVTHPRFVLRYTLAICVAFGMGWVGIWNVLPAYSYYPASTISVITCTFAGSSLRITILRVSGVVTGKVLGTILQLGLAVRIVWKAFALILSCWFVVCAAFFMYLHSDKELGYVYCLTVGFAAASLVPQNAVMREAGSSNFQDVTPGLLGAIISTVIGVVILIIVDLALASKATHHAWQRLLRSFEKINTYLNIAADHLAKPCSNPLEPRTCLPNELEARKHVSNELNELTSLIPHAAAEPQFGQRPFNTELYKALDRQLRMLVFHCEAMRWALRVKTDGERGSNAGMNMLRTIAKHIDGGSDSNSDSVKKLADRVIPIQRNSAVDREVLTELRSTTYTCMILCYIAALATCACGRRSNRQSEEGMSSTEIPLQRARASSTGSNSSTLSMSRLVVRIREAFAETIDDISLSEPMVTQDPRSFRSMSRNAPVLAELKKHAEEQPPRIPHMDDLCHVSLLDVLSTSVFEELHQMRDALLRES